MDIVIRSSTTPTSRRWTSEATRNLSEQPRTTLCKVHANHGDPCPAVKHDGRQWPRGSYVLFYRCPLPRRICSRLFGSELPLAGELSYQLKPTAYPYTASRHQKLTQVRILRQSACRPERSMVPSRRQKLRFSKQMAGKI